MGLLSLMTAATLVLPLALPASVAPPPASPLAEGGFPERAIGITRPIRTNEPGTGVFIGSGSLGRVQVRREVASTGEELRETLLLADLRYTPATHWIFGARLPIVRRSLRRGTLANDASAAGIGDLTISGKYRFYRSVGRWSDRHAAVEVATKLPTGSTTEAVGEGLPLPLRRRLQPGTGSTDFVVDLIYQEGRRRFVYGGDIAYFLTTADGTGYEFGNELRLSLDFEYILLPIEYRRPGRELFVLLEATVVDKQQDRLDGIGFEQTARTEILLAPGVQYIATERLLVSFSAQFPVYSRVAAGGLASDFDLLGEFRYAF